MANSEIRLTRIVILNLNEAEATYLRDLLQNPLVSENNQQERNRCEIFHALAEALK
jgi:hypothetical protein